MHNPKGPSCETGQLMLSLPESEREEYILEAKERLGLTWKQIAVSFEKAGYGEVSYNSLRRHMRGDCGCKKAALRAQSFDLFTPREVLA